MGLNTVVVHDEALHIEAAVSSPVFQPIERPGEILQFSKQT